MVTYYHRDLLSPRVETNGTGTITRTNGHLSFGETWYETGAADKWKFTTYERDSETGLDYAMNRFYSSRFGRFMSSDPVAGALDNPQSLNRYEYALDDPTDLVDPLGLRTIIWKDCYEVGGENGDSHTICVIHVIDIPDRLTDGDCPPRKKGCNADPKKEEKPKQPKPCTGAKGGAPLAYSATGILAWPAGLLGLGPALSISWVPGTRELFIAPGVGGTVGHNLSGGTLIGPNPSAVLPGWSVGLGYNATPVIGAQATGNSSGVLAGNSFGVPGVSTTLTYGFCFSF